MSNVTSRDGTPIAFDRQGSGPAVILVGGGLTDRTENAPLAPELAHHFTVYNYDRRGRGHSGDTAPYALDREIDDLDALIAEAGGSAHLFGASSGGALALEAAAAGLPIERIAVYEVPYSIAADAVHRWRAYVPNLTAALADGRRADALDLFMRLAGSSDQDIASARLSPMWPPLESIAHTLAYDAACLRDGPPPTARLARITQPTLVATGATLDPHPLTDFYNQSAAAIAAALPHARRLSIETQGHVPDPKTLAPVLLQFFRA
jgi:pimeloyl-ACP methyl ester carboxylesterase